MSEPPASSTIGDFWFKRLTTIAKALQQPDVVPEKTLLSLAHDIQVSVNKSENVTWVLQTVDSLADVEAESVTWAWEPYFAYGMFTLVEGDPGAGKSYTLGAITTAFSKGGRLPDQNGDLRPVRKGKTLLCANEDHWGNTIRPRHEMMGADLKMIRPVFNIIKKVGEQATEEEDELYLDERGIGALELEIEGYQPDLVVVDPLSAYFPPDRNQAREVDVRTVLRPLARLAQKHGCAIIGVRHLTKMPGANLLYSGQGSIAYIAQARFALRVGIDPGDKDTHFIMPIKNSITKKAIPQAFTLNEYGEFFWAGPSAVTSEEIAAMSEELPGALNEATDFLHALFDKTNDIPCKKIEAEARELQISQRTLKRAKAQMRIKSKRIKDYWAWHMPAETEANEPPPTTIPLADPEPRLRLLTPEDDEGEL